MNYRKEERPGDLRLLRRRAATPSSTWTTCSRRSTAATSTSSGRADWDERAQAGDPVLHGSPESSTLRATVCEGPVEDGRHAITGRAPRVRLTSYAAALRKTR